MMVKDKDSFLVYSTDKSWNDAKASHTTKQESDGFVRIRRETKGRKGSGVITVSGLTENNDKMKQIAKHLKKRCGTGGSVKDGVIEIQGDKKDIIKGELEALGYKVKISGG